LLRLASATRLTSRTLYENGAAQTACLLKGASRKTRPVKIPADVPYTGHLIDLTAKITATEPEPVASQ
jgi:hypothetical protein